MIRGQVDYFKKYILYDSMYENCKHFSLMKMISVVEGFTVKMLRKYDICL